MQQTSFLSSLPTRFLSETKLDIAQQPKVPCTMSSFRSIGLGPSVTENWKDRQEDFKRATQIALCYALPTEYVDACQKAAANGNIHTSLTDLMQLTSAIFYAPISEASKKALLHNLSRGMSPSELSADLKTASSLPNSVSSKIASPPLQGAQSTPIQPQITLEKMPIADILPEAPKNVVSSTQSSNISERANKALKASGSVKCPELKKKLAAWSKILPYSFLCASVLK
jgi:hypothetical protein